MLAGLPANGIPPIVVNGEMALVIPGLIAFGTITLVCPFAKPFLRLTSF